MNSAKVRKDILAKIKALQKDLEALNRLEREYGTAPKPEGESNTADEAVLFEAGGKTLAVLVKEAIDSLGEAVFTKGDVIKQIKAQHPAAPVNEAYVATILSRLGRSSALQTVEKGIGKNPTKYKNPNAGTQIAL